MHFWQHLSGNQPLPPLPPSSALTSTFDLKIEGHLLETMGVCIPSNNTIFIKSVSETLASNEPHLTLEFLEECIQGFRSVEGGNFGPITAIPKYVSL